MKVTLRTKDLSGDKERLYLDIYNPNAVPKRAKESLGLYLFKNPKNPLEKYHNKETRQLAEAKRAERQIDFQNGLSGYKTKPQKDIDFIEYFRKLTDNRKDSIGNYGNWDSALKHVKSFLGNKVSFAEITPESLEAFKKYLTKKLSKNSASSYFAKVKAVLNQAFEEKIIDDNPGKRVKNVRAQNPERVFLTEEELEKLFKTKCPIPVLKRAFLFSALTGLRWSDVIKLKWSDIHNDNSIGSYILYKQKKTQKHENLPINETAIQIIGTRKDDKDKVFPGLVYSAWTNQKLDNWVRDAEIKKHITFHCARHTYATLLMTKDVDIATISKLLGHSELKTTMIYTRVLDQKKINAISRLPVMSFNDPIEPEDE